MAVSVSRVSDSVLSTGEIVKVELHSTPAGKFYSLTRESGHVVTTTRKSSITSRLKSLKPVSTFGGGVMGAMVLNTPTDWAIECLGFRTATREFVLRGDNGHTIAVPSLNCVPCNA